MDNSLTNNNLLVGDILAPIVAPIIGEKIQLSILLLMKKHLVTFLILN